MALPYGNAAAPLAAVLINPATGGQYRLGGADVASPVTKVANLAAPMGAVLFDPVSQTYYVE
jgi:hypothetical protein